MSISRIRGLGGPAVILWIALPAAALPTQPKNPHPDGNGKISFQKEAGDPDTHNHFHLPGVKPEQSAAFPNLTDKDNDWIASSVWDNRELRFTPTTPDSIDNALWEKFAHGFINSAEAPIYCFDATVPADARKLVGPGFETWAKAAAGKSKDKTTPDGTALVTGIAFREKSKPEETCDFGIEFRDNLLGQDKIFGVWVHTRGASNRIGPKTLSFDANPFIAINVRGESNNWHVRKSPTDSFGMQTSIDVGWGYTKKSELVGEMDIDYKCVNLNGCGGGINFNDIRKGNEADFKALNLELGSNVFRFMPAADKVNFYKLDFWTILLHEEGHVLGLGHDPASADSSIMQANIVKFAAFGEPFPLQDIDSNSAIGAAALYTIPVPEPAALAWLIFAGLAMRRRRT